MPLALCPSPSTDLQTFSSLKWSCRRESSSSQHFELRTSHFRGSRDSWASARLAASAAQTSPLTAPSQGTSGAGVDPEALELAAAKEKLFSELDSVQRGAATDSDARAAIEEAQVNLESLGGGSARLLDPHALDKLHGLWRLRYSSASDVLSILRLPSLSPLPFPIIQVGDIYQDFICRGHTASGIVQNVVEWSLPGLLEESKGARFAVTADFSVRSSSGLKLTFREAAVDSLRLSDASRAVLAPAFLPRTQLSLDALQFFQGFQLSVPLQPQSNGRSTTSRSAGGLYVLTFLDEDTLIGRATAPSGSFIFERVSGQ